MSNLSKDLNLTNLLLCRCWMNWRSEKLLRVGSRLQWIFPFEGALSWDKPEGYIGA